MAVIGAYITWRIRQAVLPFVRVYGQWVEERILPLADQLEQMANAVEKEAYDRFMSQPVGGDYSGDWSDEAEAAYDIGLSFYENISNMYQATLNLFAAGLFHVAEQQLANLTRDGAIGIDGPDTKLDNVLKWYERHFQLDLTQFPSWVVMEELRLVANATKHAEGSSATKLRSIHPDLFQHPITRKYYPHSPLFQAPLSLPLGGDGLYVSGDDFRNYHKGVLDLLEWIMKHFEEHGDEYYPRP